MGSPNIRVDINKAAIPRFKQRMGEALEQVMTFLVTKSKRRAPVDTGEFMRSIDKAMINHAKAVIGSSDKPGKVWALEQGHSSQAPNGVFIPTIKGNERQIKKIFREKLGD